MAGPAVFTRNLEMRHASARMLEIPNFQFAQLVSAKRVIEKGGEDRAIALVLEALASGRGKELPCLVIA